MTDFQAHILAWISKQLVRLSGVILLPWSIIIAIKQKRLNKYRYEVARAWDILANKLYEPVFNEEMGDNFGKDETISQCMARNKRNGTDTKTAKKVEKLINFFDKNHLSKVNL